MQYLPEPPSTLSNNAPIQLYCAIRDGNIPATQRILDNYTLQQLEQSPIFTVCPPVGIAALLGHLELVRFLLDRGASIEAIAHIDEIALPPIYMAAVSGNREMVKLLLDRGASLPQFEILARLLATVASSGRWEIVKMLIETRNVDDVNLTVLLVIASEAGNYDTAAYLVQKGANVHADQALALAASRGHYEVVKLLIDTGDHSNEAVYNAIVAAADGGHKQVVKFFLDLGMSLQQLNFTNVSSPLLAAAQRGNIEIVGMLLDYGVQIDYHDHTRSTALHYAVGNGYFDMVIFLLDRGAKIDELDRSDATPLVIAAEKGFTKIAELLLSRGSAIKNEDDCSFARTPIVAAASGGHCEMIQLLLDRGANVDEYHDDEYNSSALMQATARRQFAAAKLLVEKGADIDHYDFERQSALYLAAQGGHLELVKFLLDNGANPNSAGNPPLFVACAKGFFEIANLLLQRGAAITADVCHRPFSVDEFVAPSTALVYTARHQSKEAIEFAKLLIKRGVDVNLLSARDFEFQDPETALHVAIMHKCVDMVWLLTLAGANTEITIGNRTPYELCNEDPELIDALRHLWSPERHSLHKQPVKDAIYCFLLAVQREGWLFDNPILFEIFKYAAYDWF